METKGLSKEGILKACKINILLIEESGNGIRAVRVSSALLAALLLFSIVFTASLAWILYDYKMLKPEIGELAAVENRSLHQEEQIAYLKQRIQDIHERLKELNECDLRLRTIAHIATGEEKESLVGVGGSEPGGIGGGAGKADWQMVRPERDYAPSLASTELEGEGIREFLRTGSPHVCMQCTRWPARGWVCSHFGSHPDPPSGEQEFHKGVDIAMRENAPVLAPAEGVIASVDWQEGYGRRVVLAHGLGLVSVFSHLEKVLVTKGELIRQGEVVATAGGTGGSIGPYVHYEVHLYGVPVDPQRYMKPFQP